MCLKKSYDMTKHRLVAMDSTLKNISARRVQTYWDEFEYKATRTGDILIHPPQKKAGDDITKCFLNDGYVATTMCAPCQWGKTGTMLQLVKNVSTYCEIDKLIPYEHIYIITGLNSIEWKEQTIERFPECFNKNILHLPDLNKILPERMKKCKDALFIIDECHIANASSQTLATAFKSCEIFDIQYMKDNNIKILQVSATPDNAAHDMKSWGDDHRMYIPEIPDSYVSFEKLIEWRRVYDKLDLRDEVQLHKFFTHIISEFTTPKYHILRVNTRHSIRDDINTYADKFNVKIINHDCSERIENVDEFLSNPPTVHTLIIIKQMWKAAKTLNDKYIGVVHESVANTKNYSTEIQGLCGRLCGHDKIHGKNGPMLFCDKHIIFNYIELIKCHFNYKIVEWRSDRIKSNGYGRVDSKCSYLNAQVVDGLKPICLAPVKGKDYSYKIHWISLSDLRTSMCPKKFLCMVKTHLNVKSHLQFEESNCDDNGFYKCSVTQGKRVYTKVDLMSCIQNMSPISNLGVNLKQNNYIITKGSKFARMYVCYEDFTPQSVKNPILCVRIFHAKKDCDFSETTI